MSGETKAAPAPEAQPQVEEVKASPVVEETPAPETAPVIRKQPKPLSMRDPGQLARAFAESGYWKHVTKPAQAVVIMAHGEELGLSPMASMQGITIIEGNIGYRGNLIATLLRQHPSYDYKVIRRANEGCTLQFTIDGQPIDDDDEGKVSYTVEDAERAELVKPRSNWAKTPRAMCFNRVLTEGARVYFPDLTSGTPVYSTEEIEEVVHVEARDVEVHNAQPAESEAPTLDPDRVDQLMQGFEVAGGELGGVNPLDGLNMLLGEIGADSFDPATDLREQMASLTPAHADALDAEFQKAVEEAPIEGEVVDEESQSGETGEANADA